MTTPFKIAASLVAALALACILVIVLQDDDSAQEGPGYELEGDGQQPTKDGPELEGDRGAAERTMKGKGADVGPDGGGNLVGARTPSGIDYSDPEVRDRELRKLLAEPKPNWQEVAKIVALMGEPIPEELRKVFLDGLVVGPRRSQTMFAFAVLRDGSFVEDLFRLLDDTSVVTGARSAVLAALWQMPGGDRDQIVLQLESRLTGDPRVDQQLIQASNRRGGPEAARALVEYLQGVPNPRQIPQHILRSLDLSDPATSEVFATALRQEAEPKVLKALITTASQSGGKAMVDPLISIDRDGVPDDVRQQVLDALGKIGNTAAVDYLLRKAEQPGVFGTRAVRAIGTLNTSERGVAKAIAEALDGANNSPHGAKYKRSLLAALGRARSPSSLASVAKSLDDGDAEVRIAAVEAMGSMGHRAQGYVGQLERLFEKSDNRSQKRIAVALAGIGGDESLTALRAMLKKEGIASDLKQTVQMALRKLEDDKQRARGG